MLDAFTRCTLAAARAPSAPSILSSPLSEHRGSPNLSSHLSSHFSSTFSSQLSSQPSSKMASRPASSGSRPASGGSIHSLAMPPSPDKPAAPHSYSGLVHAGALNPTTYTAGHAEPVVGGMDAPAMGEPEGVLVAMPCGSRLQIAIFSTWGDPYYVGLSALEAFDEEGEPIDLGAGRLWADPADVNVLPEFAGRPAHLRDPRVVSNLADGHYSTCDDKCASALLVGGISLGVSTRLGVTIAAAPPYCRHLWLAPFTRGTKNVLGIDLPSPKRISMIRIWNYNKSRIHSFRGARHIELRLDGTLVFRGEINKAPGNLQASPL